MDVPHGTGFSLGVSTRAPSEAVFGIHRGIKAERKPNLTFNKQLAMWAKEVREQADALPPGPERKALLKKAKQAAAIQLGKLESRKSSH